MPRLRLGSLLGLFLVACTPQTQAQAPGGSGGADNHGSGGTTSATGGTTNTGGTPPATGGSGGGSGPPGTGGASASGGAPSGSGGTGGASAVPDATAPDHPAGDAAAPLPAACAPGALLCEDFETFAPGPNLGPTWNTDVMGGTLQVDSTKPFAGKQALHISAKAATSSLLQITKQGAPLFPVAGNAFYGRMMMWLTQMPTGEVHFNTVQANGLLPGSTKVAKYAYGAMYARLMAGYTIRADEAALPSVDCGKSGPTGYPEKKWVCVEWRFDGPNNEMHHWLDGQAQTGVDVVKVGGGCVAAPPGGIWQAPTFNKLMIGWYAQPFNQPIDLWVDDVAVGTERLGCPRAPQ